MALTIKSTYKLNNGITIPVIALGVYLTGTKVTKQVVYDALEAGYRQVDTAEFYGNEKEVGQGIVQWLNDTGADRLEVFYTSKIFNHHQGYKAASKQIDVSLARVKELGYIDLMLVHSPLTSKEERLGTWKALQEAVKAGKIKSIGVSNYGVHHLQELYDWEGFEIAPVVNQMELNPWLMRTELDKFCQSKNIYLQAYSPLTRGAKFSDPTLVKIAEKYGKSPAQVLIRWSLQMGFIVLPKSEKKSRIVDNILVFDFELLEGDMKELSHPEAKEIFAGWGSDPADYRG